MDWEVHEDVSTGWADVVTPGAEFFVEVGFESEVEDEVVGAEDEDDEGEDPEQDLVDPGDGPDEVDEDSSHSDGPRPDRDHEDVEEEIAFVAQPGAGRGAEDEVLFLFGDPELRVRQDGGEVRHWSL